MENQKVLQRCKKGSFHKKRQSFDMMISIRIIVIESAIWLLWALLSCIDLILVNFIKIYAPLISKGAAGEATTNKPKVVIVGASFAGLATEHALSHHSNELDITIVDFKEYFEYVPGALRCFIEPEHFTKGLSCPLSVLQEKHATTVVTGEVVDVYVADNTKTNKVILRDGRVLPRLGPHILCPSSRRRRNIHFNKDKHSGTRRQRNWMQLKQLSFLGRGPSEWN
jgi:hypothetical protein